MCKVSIILPVYNGERYLEQSIRSVLNQTYTDLELVIVNDCSTDYTETIIMKFVNEDKRVKYIRNDENMKLPGSLNVGFSHATGEYYTWTSDDNMYRNDAIATMVKYLEDNPEIGMVYSDYTVINENGDMVKEIVGHTPEYIVAANVVGACFMYRKEVAHAVGNYDVSAFLIEDYDYWIRIYLSTKVAKIERDLYYYREHQSSLTSTKARDIQNMNRQIQCKYFDILYPTIKDERVLFLFVYFLRNNAEVRNRISIPRFIRKHPKYLLYYVRLSVGSVVRKMIRQ